MRRLRIGCAAVLAATVASAAAAQDTGAPDLEFLEYLGSWSGDDEEWFVDAELRAEEEENEDEERLTRRERRRQQKEDDET